MFCGICSLWIVLPGVVQIQAAVTVIIIIIIIIINEKINMAFSPKTTRTRNIPKKTKKRRVRYIGKNRQ